MSKKFTTIHHVSDVDGNIVAPGTEIEAARLGDAETIKRYERLGAVESDIRAGVIATGEADDKALEKARDEAVETAASATTTVAAPAKPTATSAPKGR